MALVKLTNTGDETFIGQFDGREYILDADDSGKTFLIVDENIAKHWFGDWSLVKEEDKAAEAKRINIYTRQNPKPGWKVKISKIIEQKRKETHRRVQPKPIVINANVETPKEAEFEDLKKLTKQKEKSQPLK